MTFIVSGVAFRQITSVRLMPPLPNINRIPVNCFVAGEERVAGQCGRVRQDVEVAERAVAGREAGNRHRQSGI